MRVPRAVSIAEARRLCVVPSSDRAGVSRGGATPLNFSLAMTGETEEKSILSISRTDAVLPLCQKFASFGGGFDAFVKRRDTKTRGNQPPDRAAPTLMGTQSKSDASPQPWRSCLRRPGLVWLKFAGYAKGWIPASPGSGFLFRHCEVRSYVSYRYASSARDQIHATRGNDATPST